MRREVYPFLKLQFQSSQQRRGRENDDDDGSVTFRASRATTTSGFMVHRGASVVRGAIKSVTTSPSAGFCEPLWRFEHQHQSELRPFAARRLTLSRIDRPNDLALVTLSSSLVRPGVSGWLASRPGQHRSAKNSIVTQYGTET